jgi:hypothetical protein
MSTFQVIVDSAHVGWDGNLPLGSFTTWEIIPSSTSKYTIDGGHDQLDFHGSADIDGAPLQIPGHVRLGGLAVLVWHHQPNGSSVPEIFSFPPGTDKAVASIGAQGGSMHFVIVDLPGTYGDNAGTCLVDVNDISA